MARGSNTWQVEWPGGLIRDRVHDHAGHRDQGSNIGLIMTGWAVWDGQSRLCIRPFQTTVVMYLPASDWDWLNCVSACFRLSLMRICLIQTVTVVFLPDSDCHSSISAWFRLSQLYFCPIQTVTVVFLPDSDCHSCISASVIQTVTVVYLPISDYHGCVLACLRLTAMSCFFRAVTAECWPVSD